jgi:hypothetical protein
MPHGEHVNPDLVRKLAGVAEPERVEMPDPMEWLRAQGLV